MSQLLKKTIRKTDWFDTMGMKTQKDQQKKHLNARKPAVLWGGGGGVQTEDFENQAGSSL